MKDIDFDELDRAVSSLLSKQDEPVASPQSAVVTNTQPTVAVATSPKTTTSPTSTTPDGQQSQTVHVENMPTISPASSPAQSIAQRQASVSSSAHTTQTTPRNVQQSPLVPKRGGQFMDVVRPAQTEKPFQPVATPKEITVRPVIPQNANITPEPISPEAALDVPAPVSLGQVAAPDPTTLVSNLDIADEDDGSLVALQNTDPQNTQVPTASEASPFIPNAVVEKRPLNALNDNGDEKDDNDDLRDQIPTDPFKLQSHEQVVPAELSQSIVDIEANEAEQPSTSTAATEQKTSQSLSIPQQYRSSDRQSAATAPVFDTSQYHAPIAANDATHHGGNHLGLWISLGVLVLVLAAAAVYYFLYLM